MRAWALVVVALLGGACEEPEEAPLGPPRCEPARELELERHLKDGFRALAEGDGKRARAAFEAVDKEEPGHPEASLGLRLTAQRGPLKPNATEPEAAGGAIVVAGESVRVPFPVEHERYRFEELAALAPLRKARDGSGPVFGYYRTRTVSGADVGARDRKGLEAAVDLIVLHDTNTQTARESIIELEGQGGSTHFVIDWDGTIYQTLDLVFEANHARNAALDARSVAIDLVNPVDATRVAGLPPEAMGRVGEGGPIERPMAEPGRLQGDEVQHWGYTRPQLASLERLVRQLGVLLPGVPLRVPTEPGQATVPRRALGSAQGLQGVVGHLHLSPRAKDPGAGFPWEAFDKAIGGR